MSSPGRGLAALPLSIVALLLATTAVLGHAELETAVPADGSTVTEPPTEIVLSFTEALNASKSSIKLVDARGATIAQGGAVDKSDPKTMRLALTSTLAPGTYEMRWTSVSAEDGDVDHGTPKFTVAAPSPTPSEPGPSPVASASASVAASPSASPSLAPSPSAAPTAPTASTGEVLIPILALVLVIAGLGGWLLSRSRRPRA
jgi:methionine-rich copper-binding protein CopC